MGQLLVALLFGHAVTELAVFAAIAFELVVVERDQERVRLLFGLAIGGLGDRQDQLLDLVLDVRICAIDALAPHVFGFEEVGVGKLEAERFLGAVVVGLGDGVFERRDGFVRLLLLEVDLTDAGQRVEIVGVVLERRVEILERLFVLAAFERGLSAPDELT